MKNNHSKSFNYSKIWKKSSDLAIMIYKMIDFLIIKIYKMANSLIKNQNPKSYILNSSKGFTLIETIVAISVLVVGIVGSLSLASSSLKFSSIFKNKLVASNLSAEGIELVYKIRDDNWLAGGDWRTDLASGDYEIDSDGLGNIRIYPYAERFLKIDSNGFYNYSEGADAHYRRKITISDGDSDPLNEIKIISTVTWTDRGSLKSISLEDGLWNWK